MTRHLCATASPVLLSVAIPLRAANRPHAGPDRHGTVVWTDDDLEKLHALGLISIVGLIDEDEPASTSETEPYLQFTLSPLSRHF